MEILSYLVITTVRIAVTVLQLMMFVRAILSWLPIEDGAFSNFLIGVTEPIIYPVRRIFDKFNLTEAIPIDMPFFVTFILLTIIGMLV